MKQPWKWYSKLYVLSHLGGFLILAITTRALLGTSQLGSKALTILANAFVVLARCDQERRHVRRRRKAIESYDCIRLTASRTNLLDLGLVKGIRSLLQGSFNGRLSMAARVRFQVQASNTSTQSRVAGSSNLKTSAVELEATRSDAIASLFARGKLCRRRSVACIGKCPRISRQYGLNRLT